MDKHNIGSDSDFLDRFLRGAARLLFVQAYADFVEESDDGSADGCAVAGPGEDWYDCAPEEPMYAYALAGQMIGEIEAASGATIYMLARAAARADEVEEIGAEEFGRYLAWEWTGAGPSWFDDHAWFSIKIPQHEVSSFSFDFDAYLVDVVY